MGRKNTHPHPRKRKGATKAKAKRRKKLVERSGPHYIPPVHPGYAPARVGENREQD